MAQPGKNSKVEVLRKNVVGVLPSAGTTQMVGSGLKPQRTGLWKVSGSSVGSVVGPDEDAALRTGSDMTAVVARILHGQISQLGDLEDKLCCFYYIDALKSFGVWLSRRAHISHGGWPVSGRIWPWNQESCINLSTRATGAREEIEQTVH